MTPQQFREKFQSDTKLTILSDIQINEALEEEPESINEDPYANWIIKVKESDSSQLEDLLDVAGYRATL